MTRLSRATIGRRIMEVTPSPALLRSRFIYDIVKSRRKLGVDLDTGVLMIMSDHELRGPQPVYRFRSGGSVVEVALSRDWGVAKEQLLDLTVDVPRGTFQYGSSWVRFSGSYRQFIETVGVLYRASIDKKRSKC